jgi:hypothetical protein
VLYSNAMRAPCLVKLTGVILQGACKPAAGQSRASAAFTGKWVEPLASNFNPERAAFRARS